MNTDAPHRMNFTHTELVGHLDMVGEVMCQLCSGQRLPREVAFSAVTILRVVRDDLAAQGGLGTKPIFREPSYLAECAMREMAEEGIFNRNNPYNEEEGA